MDERSHGTDNRGLISQQCSLRSTWDGIFKLLWNPGIDSQESTPPAYVAWRSDTTTYSYSVPSPHRLFSIPALTSSQSPQHKVLVQYTKSTTVSVSSSELGPPYLQAGAPPPLRFWGVGGGDECFTSCIENLNSKQTFCTTDHLPMFREDSCLLVTYACLQGVDFLILTAGIISSVRQVSSNCSFKQNIILVL